MDSPKQSNILISKIPKITDLQYFIALIDPKEPKDDSAPTDYQWQILKSRFMIWKNPLVLAAPVMRRTSHIHMLVSKQFVEDGSLAKCGKEHKVIISGPYEVTDCTYQECIIYSLTFRLAPKWNKVDDVYIHSNDFLTCTEPIDSIKLQLLVSGEKLSLSFLPMRVRLPLLNLVDLGVDIDKLRMTGSANINQSVHILPQLKQGTARDVTTTIPASCPFQNYSQLRRHWKNTHGYRLPHDEEGMLYVQVCFHWSQEAYTYPIVCVRPSRLVRLKCRNEKAVISDFVEDISKKFPTVCGNQLILNRTIFCPLTEVYEASKVVCNVNLSQIISNEKVRPSFQTEILTQPFSFNSRQTQCTQREPISKRSASPPLFFPSAVPLREAPELAQKVKFIPIFRSKQSSSQQLRVTHNSGSTQQRPIINPTPSFKSSQEKITPKVPIFSKSVSQTNKVTNKPAKTQGSQGTLVPDGPLKLSFGKTNTQTCPKKKLRLDVDIAVLAKSRNLQRASVPILTQFCKDKNIKHKSKDKKDVLMQKIYEFYGLS